MIQKTLSDSVYQEFSRFLEKHCGIVLGDNKLYLVRSRLSPLISQHQCTSLTELVQRAMEPRQRELRAVVIDAMTTNETLWFRDGYPFKILTEKLLPAYSKLGRPLKIWSSASSSGQEPYSIAMSCLEYQAKRPGTLPHGFQILATDISTSMLDHCKQGEYDTLALSRGLSDERLKRFFSPTTSGMHQIKPEVKNKVTFRHFNLLDSFVMLGKFDIIFCRNVLIYFSADVKKQIFKNFANALNPDGSLMLGASESMTGLSDDFTMVRYPPGIVYQPTK